MRLHPWIPALLGVLFLTTSACAADWILAPSTFTHDPETGKRVTQYAPIGPFYWPQRADYRQSGYRHHRSTLRAGGSADHMHVVEEWGRPIRPYGEWRFPYRPYSVPYDLWGEPYGGLNYNYNHYWGRGGHPGGTPHRTSPHPGGHHTGTPHPTSPHPGGHGHSHGSPGHGGGHGTHPKGGHGGHHGPT